MSEAKAYAIAQVTINDLDGYQQYATAGHPEIFGKFSGKIVAVDQAAELIEGTWPFNLIVLVEFPSKERARAWYGSDEYQAIVGLRHSNATSTVAIFGGLPDGLKDD
jgi:uncharacterized protein (DUF1330 family)